MNVENSVRRSLLHYPTLYSNKLQVLLHMFSYGTGYEWKNGQLVDPHWENQLVDGSLRDHYEQAVQQGRRGPNATDEELWEIAQEEYDRHQQAKDEIEQRLANVEVPERLHPFAIEYSNIMFIPDDVQEDWLQAALLVAQTLGLGLHTTYLQQQPPASISEDRMQLINMMNQLLGEPEVTAEQFLDHSHAEYEKFLQADSQSMLAHQRISEAALARIEQIQETRRGRT